MANTTYNVWVDKKPRKNGQYTIFLRITQNRVHQSITTGITVSNPSEFNANAKNGNYIRGREGNTKKLNEELAIKLEDLKSKSKLLATKAENPSKESIIQAFRGHNSQDFIVFLKRIIERFNSAGSHRTSKAYVQLLNKLNSFNDSKQLPFDRITVTFLKDFQNSLTYLHQNTIYEHFKNLKAAFNQAINEDVINQDQSPFRKFKIDKIATYKEKLNDEEIIKLKSINLEEYKSLIHTRNCFMFAFFCGGIRAGDLITLKWENVAEGTLSYVMSKTRKSKLIRKTIPLIPEALEILEFYKTGKNKPTDFIFGMLDNSMSDMIDLDKKIKKGFEVKFLNAVASRNTILNKNLKKIGVLAEITKPLTFHIARHSFAQYAINRNMPPKILQGILGHQKFETTEDYIDELMNTKIVENAMLELFHKSDVKIY